jgi:hypothetical protein
MRAWEFINENCGKIVKNVNTTCDIDLDSISREAAKFGNKVSRDGIPVFKLDTVHKIFESEETDEETRALGLRVFNTIQQFLSNHEEQLQGYLKYSDQFGGSLYNSANNLGLPRDDYNDLIIMFAPKSDSGKIGGFGHTSKNTVIILHCLIEPYSAKYLSTRIGGVKGSFIHEFSHYILDRRSKQDNSSSANVYDNGDTAGYFNNPQELQAYYMEMTHEAASLAKVLPCGHRLVIEWANASTSDLIEWTKQHGNCQDFLDALTPENKRRIDKRLARFVETTLRPIFQERSHESE